MAMPLQQYVRQVKPRNESYTPSVDKIQTFLTEASTKDATDMESVIAACWNNRALPQPDFVKAIGKKGIKDSASGNTYTIPRKIKNPQKTLWDFSILLGNATPAGVSGTMEPAGKEDPPLSAFW